jgi:hypothetical protein
MGEDILLGAWETAWDVVFESWVWLACEAAKGSNGRKEACTVDGRGGRLQACENAAGEIEISDKENQSWSFGPFLCI